MQWLSSGSRYLASLQDRTKLPFIWEVFVCHVKWYLTPMRIISTGYLNTRSLIQSSYKISPFLIKLIKGLRRTRIGSFGVLSVISFVYPSFLPFFLYPFFLPFFLYPYLSFYSPSHCPFIPFICPFNKHILNTTVSRSQ